ncbi:MAG: hypothetical protein R3D70_24790 [Rhizobiaceae bacterium]
MSDAGASLRSVYISLAEALTLIAFGKPISQSELRVQVEGHRPQNTDSTQEQLQKFFSATGDRLPEVSGLGHFEDRDQGLTALSQAWRSLREKVEGGTVKVRGRFTSSYSAPDAHLADVMELNGHILASFSQFDVSTGGIRRQPQGSPDVLWRYHSDSFDREFEAFGDDPRSVEGYLFVEVEKSGLVSNNHADRMLRAPSVKGGHAPSDEEIVAKAHEMKAWGMDGRTIAKEMRHEHGFENVGTTHVRELIKGIWKPGGRPKQKGA